MPVMNCLRRKKQHNEPLFCGIIFCALLLFGSVAFAQSKQECSPPEWYSSPTDNSDLLTATGKGSDRPSSYTAAKKELTRTWLKLVFKGIPRVKREVSRIEVDLESNELESEFIGPPTPPEILDEQEQREAQKRTDQQEGEPVAPIEVADQLAPEAEDDENYESIDVIAAANIVASQSLGSLHQESQQKSICGVTYSLIRIKASELGSNLTEPRQVYEQIKVTLDQGPIGFRIWKNWKSLIDQHDSKISWIKKVQNEAKSRENLSDEEADTLEQLEYAYEALMQATPAREFYSSLNQASKLAIALESTETKKN